MGLMYWFRVVVMIFAFVGVLTVMRHLNQAATQRSSAPLVEIFTGPAQAGSNGKNIDLCPTRVSEVQVLGGPMIFQKGMKWMSRTGADEAELDQIAMEKWFGKNCLLEIEPVDEVKDPQPMMKVAFISGSPQSLLASADGFVWMGRKFKSEQLETALKELANIPRRSVTP